MAFWEAAFGGSQGGYHRLRVQVDLVTQEEDNNRSLIQYNAWWERVDSTSFVYNYNPTYGNTNINGYNPQRVVNGYYSNNAGERWNLAVNEQYWIGHDAGGWASPYFGANYDAANSPYLTSAATGGNYTLPTIYRYADPTLFQVVNVTDVSMTIRVATNRVVDSIAISLTGGGNWYYFDGATTDRTMTIGSPSAPLRSGTSYPVRISLRRQSSGYWKEAGNWDIVTGSQNRFFDLGDY